MRIISGRYRGRKIARPEFVSVRPTKDRVREAVFNMVASSVRHSRVLDIFAGSGAYGLESISGGAKEAVFIEKDRNAAKVIGENIRLLGEEGSTRVIVKDMSAALELLGQNAEKFDLIFCDPPYKANMPKKTLIMVNQYDILNHSGLMVIEHHRDEGIPSFEGNVFICKQKTYGKILISIFQKK
ncbi:MAG: 16S rRNA (guanine(966)-N(2))-methyltransferase RsmD [Candidatus Omnitrophica bacterium]|nr:16S rRNA (guanine(966)-N(2))-methyltransferase RsmD [Candidatus Omnitrophota bacterium]